MGLKNTQLYKTSEHFVERAHERFGVKKDRDSAHKFFLQQSHTLDYVGITYGNNGDKREIWQNENTVFVLSPVSHVVVTVYSTEFFYYEDGGNGTLERKEKMNPKALPSKTLNTLTKTIDNEIFSNFLDFINNNEVNVVKAIEVMKTMRKTRRPDYREKQMKELESLLGNVVTDLQETNLTKAKLETMKNTLIG